MMCAKLVVFFVLLSLCYSEVINMQQCFRKKDTTPTCTVENVRMTPCQTTMDNVSCRLKKGDNGSISFDFTPKFDAATVKSKAYKVMSLFDTPYVDMDDDACKFTKCPLEANKKQTYTYSLVLDKNPPEGFHKVKWLLWDDGNHDNKCCFTYSIQITS